MKYKWLGLLACLGSVLLAVFVPTVFASPSQRVHQHLQALPSEPCPAGDSGGLCTHLPIVMLETGGAEIPGLPIYDEAGVFTETYTKAPDGETTISAKLSIVDGEGVYHHPSDEASLQSDIQIRIRGNSSRSFPKKSYAIRLVDSAGENNPQEVLGMDRHHEWVLYGPYLDKTLMRNYMWYNIAGELMPYAPNVRFCEVLLDGEYQGLYVMAESITAGKDGARLQLQVDAKHATFTGYLLRLDRPDSASQSVVDSFTTYTLRNKQMLEVIYPGKANLTPTLLSAITQDFSDFEKALYSYDYDSPKYGNSQRIDVDCFVDYFLLNELTCNYDAGWLSTYIYRDLDGKYRMCVWDFNSCCDNYVHPVDIEHFEMQNCLWYFMLMKDEDFTERIISRYQELRKTYLSDRYLQDYIQAVQTYLGPAIERNFTVWGSSFDAANGLLEPESRNPGSYELAVEQYKTALLDRAHWLDEHIGILRQYSKESKVKKFNENTN